MNEKLINLAHYLTINQSYQTFSILINVRKFYLFKKKALIGQSHTRQFPESENSYDRVFV